MLRKISIGQYSQNEMLDKVLNNDKLDKVLKINLEVFCALQVRLVTCDKTQVNQYFESLHVHGVSRVLIGCCHIDYSGH